MAGPKIYDISPKLHAKTAVFPGDQSFANPVAMSFEDGHHLRLSSIQTTLHIGAHADAPSHYHREGASIDERDPKLYLGPAQVIHVKGLKKRERVMPHHVTVPVLTKRILFRTDSFANPDMWHDEFNSLSPELIHLLSDQGVRLVGIDTPSVDPADSKGLESHQALFARDFAVLEGIVLSEVSQGTYTLIAPPLSIQNADASPVRALLFDGQIFPELL